jgi:hypothetical protein
MRGRTLSGMATAKATPGWYPDPKASRTQRYWNGGAWTDDRRPTVRRGSRPSDYLWASFMLGAAAVVVCAVIAASDTTAGYVALSVASFLVGIPLTIGIIAKAVEVGVRSAGDR